MIMLEIFYVLFESSTTKTGNFFILSRLKNYVFAQIFLKVLQCSKYSWIRQLPNENCTEFFLDFR